MRRAAKEPITSSLHATVSECKEIGFYERAVILTIRGLNLPSLANQRLHWAVRAKQVKAQRDVVRLAWRRWNPEDWLDSSPSPFRVELTRFGSRKLDSDNLSSAFKGVRDQVAAELEVDDGDESEVVWVYLQAKGKPGIEVRIS